MNFYFSANQYTICLPKTEGADCSSYKTDDLYCQIYYFFFKHCNLDYTLKNIESLILQKGNELMLKYLEDRKYNADKNNDYINNINKDHMYYIVEKNNKLKCSANTKIIQTPIKGKSYFDYLSHGKDIYRVIFQSYQNDSLICTHDLFFFK